MGTEQIFLRNDGECHARFVAQRALQRRDGPAEAGPRGNIAVENSTAGFTACRIGR